MCMRKHQSHKRTSCGIIEKSDLKHIALLDCNHLYNARKDKLKCIFQDKVSQDAASDVVVIIDSDGKV